jgi:hypothetical protein
MLYMHAVTRVSPKPLSATANTWKVSQPVPPNTLLPPPAQYHTTGGPKLALGAHQVDATCACDRVLSYSAGGACPDGQHPCMLPAPLWPSGVQGPALAPITNRP